MKYLLDEHLESEEDLPEGLEKDPVITDLLVHLQLLNTEIQSMRHVDTARSVLGDREIPILQTKEGNLVALEFRSENGRLRIHLRSVQRRESR